MFYRKKIYFLVCSLTSLLAVTPVSPAGLCCPCALSRDCHTNVTTLDLSSWILFWCPRAEPHPPHSPWLPISALLLPRIPAPLGSSHISMYIYKLQIPPVLLQLCLHSQHLPSPGDDSTPNSHKSPGGGLGWGKRQKEGWEFSMISMIPLLPWAGGGLGWALLG